MTRASSFNRRLSCWATTFVAAVAAAVLIAALVVAASPRAVAAPSGACPKLYALGVQGTGQSSSDASPSTDSGMLTSVMQPLMSMAGSIVQRAYVPYPAGLGGADQKSPTPYSASVEAGFKRLSAMVVQIMAKCPDTKLAVTGYSQGAQIASRFAREVGNGSGPVAEDKVAGVALFGNLARPQGAGLFPGASGNKPSPAPGTDGSAVAQLPAAPEGSTATGGGLSNEVAATSPEQEGGGNAGYGSLSGRVMDSCQAGDLMCDAPSGAPIVNAVTNIGKQSNLNVKEDPVGSLSSIAQALALTTWKTAVPVINEDIGGSTVEDLTYQPQQSMSKRVAAASDPNAALPGIPDTLQAIMKVGTIGLNAAVTVAKKVLTPETIGAVATVGLANPLAGLGILGAKFGQAMGELVPPATASRWTTEAFDAVKENVTDNADLVSIANAAKFFDWQKAHGTYTRSMGAGQSPATLWAAQWFAALAKDIAGQGKSFSPTDSAGRVSLDPDRTSIGGGVVPTVPSTSSAAPSTTSWQRPSDAPVLVPGGGAGTSTPEQSTETTTSSPPSG